MRSRSAISLGVAVLFGAIAVLLARGLLDGARLAGSPAQRTVVVAAGPISFGAPLTSDNLRELSWPADSVVEGAFSSVADLTADGRRLSLAALQKNEPIVSARITGPNQRATLSTQIEDGMRAVSVRVDEVRGVAGFVLPGDRVDVILTRGEGGSQETSAYADVLLQNAKVLAVDQIANDRQDKPAIARAVTLELTLPEAQKVILAHGIGDAVPEKDRIAELQRQLEETRRAAEQAQARAGDGVAQKMAEIEARLRGEMARTAPPPALPAAAPPPPPAPAIVNVTRNGAKREPYSVVSER